MTNPSDGEETKVRDGIDEAADATPQPRKNRRRRGDTGDQPEPDMMALPVMVATESLLMPHMTIPFPLDLDENAMAVDRAMRMNPRRVLVVSARPIDDEDEEGGNGPGRDLIDMVSDMIALEYEQDDGDEEYEVNGDEDDVESELEDEDDFSERPLVDDLYRVGVVAEIAQFISRPGQQDHVILQGISRGVIEDVIQEVPYLAARVAAR
mgnify:CR=1 FL=1